MINRARWSGVVGIPAGLALVLTIATARSSLPVDPGSYTGPEDPTALVINLSVDGRLILSGDPVSPQRLASIRTEASDIVLLIPPDCRGTVVRPILEQLRGAGLDDIRVGEARR